MRVRRERRTANRAEMEAPGLDAMARKHAIVGMLGMRYLKHPLGAVPVETLGGALRLDSFVRRRHEIVAGRSERKRFGELRSFGRPRPGI
jgi:hypothetical protein